MFFVICLGLFLPLFSFVILTITSKWINRQLTYFIACGAVLLSFVCFASYFVFYEKIGAEAQNYLLHRWLSFDKVQANIILHLDSLSLLMTLIVTGIGFLIHFYSTGYIDHEKDFARYFAFLNFFIFAMLLLVLAGDLLLLFVGWEGVGLASYLLIGFWYTRDFAVKAANKALIMNRIGDLGLLIGILLTFYLFGTTDIITISQLAKEQFIVGASIITILTLLYFIGATGKSAQIPLYTWLPDAMEGPTPVSALIHAATMVTAGVYLIVRMNEVFSLAPLTLQIIGTIGALTALFGAICASAQTDLKRVLAFSTISQLGLMFLACGAKAYYSAIFHLTTHAFVKALLFLCAGNVVHLLHGTTEMAKMGGLSKIFNKTHWLFLIGVLALAGIPPLAPFFSKDLILEQQYLAGFHILFYIALTASILTGFYLTRAYCLVFKGPIHLTLKEQQQIQEAPQNMLVPIFVLCGLTIFGGLLGFTFYQYPLLEEFLYPVIKLTFAEKILKSGFILTSETGIAILGSCSGIALATWLYIKKRNPLGYSFQWIKKGFYINELYWMFFALPVQKLAWMINYFFEPKFFDSLLAEIQKNTKKVAYQLQLLQSGQLRSYVAWMVLGSVILLVFLVF